MINKISDKIVFSGLNLIKNGKLNMFPRMMSLGNLVIFDPKFVNSGLN